MHIIAILFVLLTLSLAFGVIGGMLFAHRERIGEALAGYVATPIQRQERLVRPKSRISRTLAKPRAAISPRPLAA
jgi:hypothetical protein